MDEKEKLKLVRKNSHTKRTSFKHDNLPIKVYKDRNSILTDLFNEDENIVTVYNIFVVIAVCVILKGLAKEYFYEGGLNFNYPLLAVAFANLHYCLLIWLYMFLSTILIYFGFKIYITIRLQIDSKSFLMTIVDYGALIILILYYASFMYFAAKATVIYKLNPPLSLGILIEACRLLMKVHAFVRSNAPKAFKNKRSRESPVSYPTLSNYLYFSFAPVLVYRDVYPRSKGSINWTKIILLFFQFWFALYFLSFVVKDSFYLKFRDFGKRSYEKKELFLAILTHPMDAMMILLIAFYALLHSWFNAFAEMLRFSDRLFYKKWWTSTDFGRYYRTWNTVVHDWLYEYIYLDFYEIIVPKNKFVARLVVFLISAVFHEYMFSIALGFYLPILFFPFVASGATIGLIDMKNKVLGNILVWYIMGMGFSTVVCCYSFEYYARANNPTVYNFYTPAFLDFIK